MATNQQHRQVHVAVELEETARTLAHSTREIPNPADSYRLLAELSRTTDHLQQTLRQLSAWHRRVTDGQEYRGEDERGDGVTGTLEAAEQLQAAANALDHVSEALRAATPPAASSVGSGSRKRTSTEPRLAHQPQEGCDVTIAGISSAHAPAARRAPDAPASDRGRDDRDLE